MCQYSLSIALVTRNRPESLKRTLYSLAAQNCKAYEVIISDDSNFPAAIILNKRIAEQLGYKYFIGPQKGLYANRNFAAKNCTGTHIRTMDDDHEFPKDHLMVCLEAIQDEPDTIWTIGEYFSTDKIRSSPVPMPGQLHPRGYSYAPKDVANYYGISCGASIYPRSVVDSNVLNLECYKFGILYLEYGVRLFRNGFTIKHLSQTYIIHHLDNNNKPVTSKSLQKSAEVFSMFMLSFYHMCSFKNMALTSLEIARKLLTRELSIKLLKDSVLMFREQSKLEELQVQKNCMAAVNEENL